MIYSYKTEEKSQKDFRNCHNLIDLLKNLGDGDLTGREILKNQNNFKSDLGKIRKRNPKWKSEDQISVQNVDFFFFFLREKIVDFFRGYSFLLS